LRTPSGVEHNFTLRRGGTPAEIAFEYDTAICPSSDVAFLDSGGILQGMADALQEAGVPSGPWVTVVRGSLCVAVPGHVPKDKPSGVTKANKPRGGHGGGGRAQPQKKTRKDKRGSKGEDAEMGSGGSEHAQHDGR
jgi:hypothetical protein